ncbi:MAG: hypothetical protein ACK5QT_07285 [Oligoflexia bacterium]
MAEFKNIVLILMAPDAKDLEKLRDFLAERGLAVYVASGLDGAVRLVKTKAVDLLICDTQALGKAGDDSVKELLGEHGKGSDLPLILISANLGAESKTWFKKFAGVKAVIPGPLDMNRVFRIVSSNLPKGKKGVFDPSDGDDEKPLVDLKDHKGIGVTTKIRRSADGPESQGFEAALIELGEVEVLLEVKAPDLKVKEKVEVDVVMSGSSADGQFQFAGVVKSVEEGGAPGVWMVTVDSGGASSELSKQVGEEIAKRQNELSDFIRKSQG